MNPSAAASPHPPPESSETAAKPPTLLTHEASGAANDDVRVDQQRTEDDEPLGPLWMITIGMGAFFGVAALVLMFD